MWDLVHCVTNLLRQVCWKTQCIIMTWCVRESDVGILRKICIVVSRRILMEAGKTGDRRNGSKSVYKRGGGSQMTIDVVWSKDGKGAQWQPCGIGCGCRYWRWQTAIQPWTPRWRTTFLVSHVGISYNSLPPASWCALSADQVALTNSSITYRMWY